MGGLFLLIQTVMEDKVLREELAGYLEYSRRVPYRLVPGIW
jgi:protein-S-isoprenylcysteine O-methyltransferase Ste14